MSRYAWISLQDFLVAALLSAAICDLALAQQAGETWDVTKARGQTREIDFTTSEGTWMSVDISPDGRWIVFDLLGHIYRVPVEGGEAECLTQASGVALNFHPRYSPDGKQIAFVSDRKGQDNLWNMEADGSNPRPILVDLETRFTEPAWTPDGRHILAVRHFQKQGFARTSTRIWMFAREGGEGVEIVGSNSWQAYWPLVSPDGRWVYYHKSSVPGRWGAGPGSILQRLQHIERLDLESGQIEDVTESEGPRAVYAPAIREIAPEISPDGRWLAFARRIRGGTISYRGHQYGPRTALWLRDLQTGAERVIMDPVTLDMINAHATKIVRVMPGYSWAKDGKSLVLSQGGKLRRLWVESGEVETIPFTARVQRTISEAARGRTDITDEPFEVHFPRWPASSPDGRKLVFEAVGRLWMMELPNGTPARLTSGGSEAFELTPAWSPDGRWVAFATWDDTARGHLWKVSASGGTPERLSQEPGEFLHPVWSPDGRSILVTRGSGATARGETWSENTWYELVRVPASGGAAEFVVRPGRLVKASFGPGGRIYYQQRQEEEDALVSVSVDGGDRRDHLITDADDDIALSPDGKWVAFQEDENIYLAGFRSGTGTKGPIHIDEKAGTFSFKRLSLEGGLFPRWRDATTLEFVSGNRYFVYDVTSGRTDTVQIRLRIPRDIPKGTIALTGARIVTLYDRKVIDNGTLVVQGSRIACVGSCDTAGADQVLDVSGKTIIPGFVDVHAHYLGGGVVIPQHRSKSARYLAYGVTTTLDPSTTPESAFPIAELIEAGRLVGPRTFSVGQELRGWGHIDEIRQYEDAEREVNRLASWGAISIKDYLMPRRDQRQMLGEATRKRGLTLTAEGKSLLYNLGLIMDGHTGWEHPLTNNPPFSDAAKFFGQAGAVYSPTLMIPSLEYFLGHNDIWNDTKYRRFTPWRELVKTRTFVQKPLSDYDFAIRAEGVADVVRAGGHAAIGDHGNVPGLGSHWEVWVYGRALEPMEALEVASLGGAYFLGLDDDLGSIEVGKLADLMVLNSNPLEDIRNTVDIQYVMKGGRLYDGSTLDQIWPEKKPYGPYPWFNPDALRSDDRPVDYWDRRR